MTIPSISLTQTVLLGLLSQSLSGKEYTLPKETNWTALFEESLAQAVAPQVFSHIPKDQCANEEIYLRWKSFTMRSIQNNMQANAQHTMLHKLLDGNNIPYCIVKGCAASKYYPDPLLRTMGDVDFLVPDSYWDAATKLFLDNGFKMYGEEHDFHISFSKGRAHLEMHHEPFGLSDWGGEELLKTVDDIVTTRELTECATGTFYGPNVYYHGLVILMHAYRHLITDGIGVRHLCDWEVFISKFSDEEFKSVFEKGFRDLGVWKLAQTFSLASHIYLGSERKGWMGDDVKSAESLMLDILNSGNFGKKGNERYAQNMAIFDEEQEIMKSRKPAMLIKALNSAAQKRYPVFARCALLKPFGFIPIGIRYIFRTLAGKRKKVQTDKIMQLAKMRSELYSNLRTFEKDV